MTNLERMVNCQIKKANNTESYVCCEGWSSLQAVGKNLQRHDMTAKTPETPVFREFFHARKQFLAVCGAPSPLRPLKKEGDGSFRPPRAIWFYAGISPVRVVSPALPTSGGRRCRPHPDRWPSGTPARRPLSCFRRCRPRCRSQIFTLQNWRYSHAHRRNALRDTGSRHRCNGESGRRRQS